MWFAPTPASGNRLKLIRMPGIPASPTNSAHNDHRYAAETPTEMRVSMVAAPWRAFAHAAR